MHRSFTPSMLYIRGAYKKFKNERFRQFGK
jgi:hypothetical protein